MRKYGWLVLALACMGGMMAQTTDDFFSDDNDSVLEEARRRYGSATPSPTASPTPDAFFGDEEGDWVEVEREDAEITVNVDVDVFVPGPDEAPTADAGEGVQVEDLRTTEAPEGRKEGDIRLFDGLFLRFGWGDEKKNYSPVVLSLVPGISFPLGMYDTNLALGYIGSLTRSVKGLSASGVMDMIDKDLLGVQTAGVFSLVGGKAVGVQASGVFNIAGDLTGVQAAGVFNVAASVLGAQGAGVINIAGDVKGVQASGVVNVARKVTGVQVGLVNLSEEMYGIPIGLFSWTKNGIRDLGFWVDGRSNVHAYVANGTSNFYALAMVAMPSGDWFEDWRSMIAGMGLGWRAWNSKWGALDVDFVYKSWVGPDLDAVVSAGRPVSIDDFIELNYVNEWNMYSWPALRGTLSLKLGKSLELFGGASLDLHIPSWSEIPEAFQSSVVIGNELNGWAYELQPSLYWGLRI